MTAPQMARSPRHEPPRKDPHNDSVIDPTLEKILQVTADRLGILLSIDRKMNYSGRGTGNCFHEQVTVEFPSGNAVKFCSSQNRFHEADCGEPRPSGGWHYCEPSFNIGVRIGQTWLQLGDPSVQFGNRHLNHKDTKQMSDQFNAILALFLNLEGRVTTRPLL